jgi:hypothetical protein
LGVPQKAPVNSTDKFARCDPLIDGTQSPFEKARPNHPKAVDQVSAVPLRLHCPEVVIELHATARNP